MVMALLIAGYVLAGLVASGLLYRWCRWYGVWAWQKRQWNHGIDPVTCRPWARVGTSQDTDAVRYYKPAGTEVSKVLAITTNVDRNFGTGRIENMEERCGG